MTVSFKNGKVSSIKLKSRCQNSAVHSVFIKLGQFTAAIMFYLLLFSLLQSWSEWETRAVAHDVLSHHPVPLLYLTLCTPSLLIACYQMSKRAVFASPKALLGLVSQSPSMAISTCLLLHWAMVWFFQCSLPPALAQARTSTCQTNTGMQSEADSRQLCI